MQTFFQRFLEWIPWKYADNLISELLLFFVLNVLGYAFVIFLLLRVFFPDRSGEPPPLTGKKNKQSFWPAEAESLSRHSGSMLDPNRRPRQPTENGVPGGTCPVSRNQELTVVEIPSDDAHVKPPPKLSQKGVQNLCPLRILSAGYPFWRRP